MEQPHSGQYKTIVCGNCHVRGHRSEDKKNNAPCLEEPCYYIRCGQKKKHPEHFEEIRTLTKRVLLLGKLNNFRKILLRFDWRAMVKFRFLQQLVMTEINF